MEETSKKRRRSVGPSNGIVDSPKSRRKTNGADDSTTPTAQPNTLYGLIEARASEPELQDQPCILYPSHGTQYVAYSAADIDRLSKNAAAYYNTIVPARTSSEESPVVVALLAPSSFAYLITALGLSRLGHTVLLLSTRLSEDAHAHLIIKCNAEHVFADALFSTTARKVSERLSGLSVHLIASQDQIARHDGPLDVGQHLDPLRERNTVALIVHSSGSTSLPKPNYYPHATALKNWQSEFSLVGFITLPLFHVQGLGSVFRSITNRQPIYMWNASLPVTSQHVKAVLRQHPDIQILYGVPYVMKLLADSEEGIELSRRLDVLLCAGGACPKPVGDLLTSKGAYVVSHIGSSETGQLMNSYRPREDFDEWDWMRPSEKLQKCLRWEAYDSQNNLFEMVVLEGWPSKVATNRDDGSYATKDLFERHPEYPKKNAWRYYARKDDTIVLSNGEKANPILFEDCARESPLVDDAVVFGAQKPHLGIFVLPSAAASNPDQVIEVVWSLIQRANKIAPAHAQVSKEMIQVLDAGQARQIKRTDKSAIIRPAFYKEFAAPIDAAYDLPAKPGSLVLDRDDLVEFITLETKALVQDEGQDLIGGDVDLFSLGFDSLQASRLRSKILKHIDTGGNDLTESFVFDHPSINAMAAELLRTRTNVDSKPKLSSEEKMKDLVEKYSLEFPTHRPSPGGAGESDEHVVVTGATGSLGAHIVAQLASNPKVRGIYCLVRAKSHKNAHERVRQSLRERGLVLHDNRLKAFAVDFNDPRLSLSDTEYSELAGKATSVIHSAWNVNFNLSLESFESDCIRGTRSLIDLCLQAGGNRPAKFIFCSSVSAVASTPSSEIGEEACSSLTYAQNIGYAQSKLVAENICLNASRESGLDCCVLRIGQIVGDTTLGIWNRQEAVPMIVRSANTIKTLPELDEDCSWLPVDTVAKAVIDCKDHLEQAKVEEVLLDVYNIVNENRFHWSRDLMPMLRSAGLEFEAASPQEWLKRLREHPDPATNPPYRLIDFFTAKYGGDVPRKAAKYRCEKARSASAALREYDQLDQELLNKFVRHILDM